MTKPLVQNTASRRQVKQARLKERFGRKGEIEDLRFVLGARRGRRFVWRYLSRCGVFRSAFSKDAAQTHFNLGEQNIGLMLLADVEETDASALLAMMTEAKEDGSGK